jgi:hypothetical protein
MPAVAQLDYLESLPPGTTRWASCIHRRALCGCPFGLVGAERGAAIHRVYVRNPGVEQATSSMKALRVAASLRRER